RQGYRDSCPREVSTRFPRSRILQLHQGCRRRERSDVRIGTIKWLVPVVAQQGDGHELRGVEREARIRAQIEPFDLQVEAEIDRAATGVIDAGLERVGVALARLERELRAIRQEQAERYVTEQRAEIELAAGAEDERAQADARDVAVVAVPLVLRRGE